MPDIEIIYHAEQPGAVTATGWARSRWREALADARSRKGGVTIRRNYLTV